MPAGPNESLVTTVFGDVHYFFSDPSSKPQHHRFDRGSYVYLFNNPAQRQAKLEIANHAGTPDQDAFYGYLNAATVQYSHLQPTLFTISIHPAVVQDQSTWHLPTFDERNQQKYMYKIHTLDIYLWTEKDASSFLAHLKTVLGREQLDIKNAPASSTPHAEHRDSMSPVVQQLEQTAIGSSFPPRAISAVSAQSLPGPPTPAASSGGSPKPVVPMAYNPAAPAAPEPVQYREKTPPPPDDGTGTGLSHAAKYDTVPQPQYTPGPYQSSAQTTPQNAYFSGPPQHQGTPSQSSFPGPPGGMPPPQQRAPSFGPMAQSTLPQSPPPSQQSFQRQSSFGAPATQTQYATYNPQQTQYANYPGTPSYNPQLPPTPSAPPAYSAGPLQSPGIPPPPPQQIHEHQPPPIGGYSNYSYSATQASQSDKLNAHGGYTGDIHNQAYRPTEAESSSHGHHKPKRTQTGSGSNDGKPPKISDSLGKVDQKVAKVLGRFDKLW